MTAWELIGWDDGLLRIKGGRAVYEYVANYVNDVGADWVKLQRIDPISTPDGPKLRVVTRYVDPDTVLEPANDAARANLTEWRNA